MTSSIATAEICLPLTALENVSLGQNRLLLAGQGPFLLIFDLINNKRFVKTRIFEVQAIHGICVGVTCLQNTSLQVAIFGGGSVAVALLQIRNEEGSLKDCNCSTDAIFKAPDWILKVHHHAFRAREAEFVLLTANNTLHRLSHSGVDGVGWSLGPLAEGPKLSLYAGDICSVHHDHLLVAGGSVFGEVVFWACKKAELTDQWEVNTTHRFSGHHGSIFGVAISLFLPSVYGQSLLIASCSDDRTIQIWDVSDHELMRNHAAEPEIATETGFGQDDTSFSNRLALVSGHVSRIWDVKFLTNPTDSPDKEIYIISRGEDATCKLWSFDPAWTRDRPGHSSALSFVSSDHHHFGKNAMSWTQYDDGLSKRLVSGGADGRIVRRPLWLRDQSCEIFHAQPFRETHVNEAMVSLKDYLIIDLNTVLAISTSGLLFQCHISNPTGSAWHIDPASVLTPVTRLCSNTLNGIVISATKRGVLVSIPDTPSIYVPLQLTQPISWMRLVSVSERHGQWNELLLLVTFPDPKLTSLVHIKTAYLDYEQDTVILNLPKSFIVTSACYSSALDLLFLGSRSGSMAVRSIRPCSAPLNSTDNLHGPDAVTSLTVIREKGMDLVHVLSTGRDGSFAINEIQLSSSLSEYSIKTLHKSSLQFGLSIEGAMLSAASSSDGADLIFYGFRSQDFVVWNYTKQAQITSVGCGGAHRNWAYALASDAQEHAFVWTKASTFNYLRRPANPPVIVQEGGHGREIKALAIRPRFRGQASRSCVIATGAEDTTIRLFAAQKRPKLRSDTIGAHASLELLTTLTSHTTGVQDLAFSSCGNYLFSSGGNGELFAWAVKDDVPIVGVGVTLLNRMIQNSDDADARILSFDIIPSSFDDSGDSVEAEHPIQLIVAYSNGKMRKVDYNAGPSPGEGSFCPIMEIVYGTFCLTQVEFHQGSLHNEQVVLAAGTNGFLYGDSVSTTSFNRFQHRIHQSSVLAMDYITLGRCSIAVTGGDDNALAVTLLQPAEDSIPKSSKESQERSLNPRTVIIPKAHAAALTALTIICHQEFPWGHAVVVVSIGNDQRVKVWGIKLRIPGGICSKTLEELHIFRLHEAWTCVADVSNADLLGPVRQSEAQIDFEVIIVGVGMEVLNINVDVKDLFSENGLSDLS